ncbi:MAG: Sec-independent protein translocase protein TatB [Cellvibrionaceae bacterium]
MGFFEILLIAVVTLLVVGPERMPEAVRTVALTVGRIKRSFDSAKSEIEKQVGADEIRRQLHNEAVMDNVNKIKSELSELDQKIDSGERKMPWTEDDYNEDEEIEKYLLESHPEKATPKNESKDTPSV